MLYPNSIVQEIHAPHYELEFDFSNNDKEQMEFLNHKEADILPEQTLTFLFKNEVLPSANMVSITRKNDQLEYQLSIVFSRSRWNDFKCLEQFVPAFIQHCRQCRLDIRLEGEDDYFCYLLLTKMVFPETSIACRVNTFSTLLVDKISKLL